MSEGKDRTVDLLKVLQAHRAELQRRGFAHVGVFGSAARGDAHEDSDVDLLVELDASKRLGLEYFETLVLLERLLNSKVDVVTLPVRNPGLAQAIDRDLVHAF